MNTKQETDRRYIEEHRKSLIENTGNQKSRKDKKEDIKEEVKNYGKG